MPLVDTNPTRGVIYCERSCGTEATEACHSINAALGKGCVSYETVRRWFISFSNGEIDMEDKPRSGLCTSGTRKECFSKRCWYKAGQSPLPYAPTSSSSSPSLFEKSAGKGPRSPSFMTTPAPTSRKVPMPSYTSSARISCPTRHTLQALPLLTITLPILLNSLWPRKNSLIMTRLRGRSLTSSTHRTQSSGRTESTIYL